MGERGPQSASSVRWQRWMERKEAVSESGSRLQVHCTGELSVSHFGESCPCLQ